MFNYVFQPDWGLLNGVLRAARRRSGAALAGRSAPRPHRLARRGDHPRGLGRARLLHPRHPRRACSRSRPISTTRPRSTAPTRFQIWRHITLPSLRPTFIFLIMTGTIDAMARFADLWTLGGPGGAPARSLQSDRHVHVPDRLRERRLSLAAAIAVVFFLIVLAHHARLPSEGSSRANSAAVADGAKRPLPGSNQGRRRRAPGRLAPRLGERRRALTQLALVIVARASARSSCSCRSPGCSRRRCRARPTSRCRASRAFWPPDPSLFNYKIALDNLPIAAATTSTASSSSARPRSAISSSARSTGYAFAKGRFPGKTVLFIAFLVDALHPVRDADDPALPVHERACTSPTPTGR